MTNFAPFRLDDDQILWRGTTEVRLTPKASTLLGCLVAQAGAWVPKPAIMSAVWPDTHVQPENVKVLVREVRLALGDDCRSPRYIRSAAGRGYMFVAPVTETDGPTDLAIHSEPSVPPLPERRWELARLADALSAARASGRLVVVVPGPRGESQYALCARFLRGAPQSTRVRHGAAPLVPARSGRGLHDSRLRLVRKAELC